MMNRVRQGPRLNVQSVLLLASALAVFACLLVAASGAAAAGQPFTVSSTLSGTTVLPHRIHWLGRPSLPAAKVAEVDFLIDGKVSWVEHHPPYTFGDDGNWLVTSWLAPGSHRFTVRARAANGGTAKQTTAASVAAAPPPPAALAGTWTRTVTQKQAGANTPAGTWALTVDETGWKILDPLDGGVYIDVAYLAGGRLQARGGIMTTPHSDYEGNGWCMDTNTPVDYRWAVSGSTLTLTLDGPDGCGPASDKQHFIWAGAWTRHA
jgi:hypothetical protein